MVMVGPDLAVRRFTPQATRVLGLTSVDVGRPLPRLRLKLQVKDLEKVLLDVISEVRPSQHRVHNDEGKMVRLAADPVSHGGQSHRRRSADGAELRGTGRRCGPKAVG